MIRYEMAEQSLQGSERPSQGVKLLLRAIRSAGLRQSW